MKKKQQPKKYSLISLCLTHIYCYSFILHAIFVCLQYAICWYISLRSTPQIHSRAVSAFPTHTRPFSLSLSFISIQILFSHPSKLYVRQKQRKKKTTEYVEHFIISNTFSRHFVRKKNHNNNEFARHIRILMKHCFSSKCVPIIMHFHCISKSIPLFIVSAPHSSCFPPFLDTLTHSHKHTHRQRDLMIFREVF